MLRTSLTRLGAAVTAAGAACALGSAAAIAAPAASWSGPGGPVPGAFTNEAPALAAISFPGPIGQGVVVAWRGRSAAGHVQYKFRSPAYHTGRWSKVSEVPGARTNAAPAIGAYRDPSGREAVLAVWTGHADHHIWYAQGRTQVNGTISWTKPADLPASVKYSGSVSGPAVFFPGHKNAVMIAWRGPASHVRYVLGLPKGRGFTWSASRVIPGNVPSPSGARCRTAPCTSATPAITEESAATGKGRVLVFWKQLGSGKVFYAATPDPLTVRAGLKWTAPAQVPGAATATSPAVSVLGVNGFGPLLLAYKAPATTAVRFQTLTTLGWSTAAVVPGARTTVAPALLRGLLATTTPTTIGTIILHAYS